MDFLADLNYWQWWILAVALVILEMFVPGTVLLWMGISAGLVGVLVLVFPGMSWEIQYLIFAVLSIAAIFGSRTFLKRHPIETDQPTLNRRGSQYVDRVFNLDEAIVNGQGKIRVDDSTWKIHGDDVPAGSKVRVTGVDGVVLTVEPVE